MAWKRFAIGQAEVIARDLDEPYLHTRITESKSLLARIAGNASQAVAESSNTSGGELLNFVDKRTHSAMGLATIQHSLNCAQVEDIPGARKALEQWRTVNGSCSMEQVVQFRIGMLLGRFLRYQGEFAESLAHLKRSRDKAEERGSLSFDEDLRDLTCDLADTLRELDDPIAAEHHLRAEITRRDRSSACSSQVPLQLCLAEALFAQGHFEEAEQLGLEIKSRPNLLRFEKLRTHIVLAKIYHVKADNEDALSHWSAALKEVAKFRLTNGRTTRTIVLSISDILRRLGDGVWVEVSLKEAACLDQLAQPGGTRYWIAGMRHWLAYLQLERPRSRM
jgi:tetratricopeptide (TPR) repeat protein